MIDRISRGAGVANAPGTKQAAASQKQRQSFGQVLQGELQNQVNFSKHAISRAEERGIELTPTLMEKLAGSLEKAQEKGAKNILAFDATQAFILNVPYGRVITTMSQDEMKENIFTNIDGAVLL